MILHHIALIISSEHNLKFFELFGFVETFRKKRDNDTIVLMKGHGIELEIFIDSRHNIIFNKEQLGIRHFALQINGKLEEEITRIAEQDSGEIEISSIMYDWNGVRFCLVKNHDGVEIELREKN